MTVDKLTQPISLLITDDDDASRQILREIFEPEGYRTLLASSGAEAIEIVQSETIHLAILDMHMPKLTGLETLQIVRQIHSWLPAILMTAQSSRELIRRAFSAQVYSVLPKPVTKSVVLYTVIRALGQAQRETQEPPLPDDPTKR